MKYSIIIPAYNEEKRISKTVARILEFFEKKKVDFEIIVVNDGSKDKTSEAVKIFRNKKIRLLEFSPNHGKGFAVKQGMLNAKGDIILFSDADLSTPIEEFDKLINYIKDFDVIIGSRSIKGANVVKHQPFYRELMGKIFNKIVRLFTIRGIIDTQCGFKMFNQKAAKDVFSKTRITGFGFDVEALFLAKILKYKIKEVPVTWINDEQTKISPVKDSLKMFIEVLKVRINYWEGKYK